MKDEFEWIKGITPSKVFQTKVLKQGIGDDAAVFEGNSSYDELVCMDTMVEGVHFSRKTMEPLHIGYKALASNLSDIAAMGGVPLFYLVSIAIPSNWTENELKEIYKGMSLLADQHRVDLIGGDTVSTKNTLVLSVTVLGRVKKGHSVLRSSAKPGDLIFVTGVIGDSACGLSLLLRSGLDASYKDEELMMIKAHQMPKPQVVAGQLLSDAQNRISLNDISDGIASEANEIAEASNVQLEIDYDKLPISEYIRKYQVNEQLKWTLYGGEDYQLIGTIEKEHWPSIQKVFKEQGLAITTIGKVTDGEPKVTLNCQGERVTLQKDGFNHFKK
jgi:thiamine-monophosphate kinase